MIWMLPLIGAAAGALMNKKDPLKGALMGGALGLTGGALAPAAIGTMGAGGGLLGSAAATGAAGAGAGSYAAGALGTAGGYGGLGAATAMPGAAATGGLFGSGYTGAQLMGGLKSAGEAAGAAQSVSGLMAGEETQPAQLQQGNPAGPQTVAQIYQASQQSVQDQIDRANQERMRRRQQNWG